MADNNQNKQKYGEKLAARRARRNGRGSTISIPYECVDIRYNRYIDRNTGIITLIPDDVHTIGIRGPAIRNKTCIPCTISAIAQNTQSQKRGSFSETVSELAGMFNIAHNNNYAQYCRTHEYPGAEKKNNHQKATKIQQMETGNIGRVTTEEAAEMIEMAVEDRTQREIAEETGRHLRTVNKTIRTATKQITEYKAAEYWEILGKYHNSLEAIAERARDEYLGAPIGQADPRNAAAAIATIREDAKLLRLAEFLEKSRAAAAEPQRPRIIKIRKSFRIADNPEL